MTSKTKYSELLRDPRWQKRRLEIFERDDFRCGTCDSKDKTLHVHHLYYVSGRSPWEYPDWAFQTLCKPCHDDVSKDCRDDDGTYTMAEWEQGVANLCHRHANFLTEWWGLAEMVEVAAVHAGLHPMEFIAKLENAGRDIIAEATTPKVAA